MPILALPPSNTPRWWMDYTVNGDQHSILCRTTDAKTEGQVSSVLSGFFDLFSATSLYEINFVGLRKAAEGSDITLPAVWSGNTAWGSGSAATTDQRAHTYSFTGRSENGHKNKVFVFGAKLIANGDYRIQVGEDADIDAVVTFLNAVNGFFLAIDGAPTIFNAYANSGFNDHWIRVARG